MRQCIGMCGVGYAWAEQAPPLRRYHELRSPPSYTGLSRASGRCVTLLPLHAAGEGWGEGEPPAGGRHARFRPAGPHSTGSVQASRASGRWASGRQLASYPPGFRPVTWHQKNEANAPGCCDQSVHACRMAAISEALAQSFSCAIATNSGSFRIECM